MDPQMLPECHATVPPPREPLAEARFRELIEGLDAIVAEYDARSCRFTFVSQRAEQLLGHPTSQWLESGFWERILHPEDRSRAVEFCQMAVAQAVDHEFEYRVVSSQGRVFWLRETARVVRDVDGRAERLFILMTDESARKRAEFLLESQRSILELVAQAATREAVLGAILQMLSVLLPGVGLALLVQEGARARVGALRGFSEAELQPYLQAQAPGSFPIRASDGHLLGALVTHPHGSRDLGQEEHASLQLAVHLAALALERAEIQEALESRMKALAEADRRKDEFLAMLGHELRNPLAPMLTAVKMLPAADESRRPRLVGTLERQLEHLVRLVDDLLDVARVSQGRIQVCKAPVELTSILNQAVEMVRPFIHQQQHRLSLSFPPGPIELMGDSARLQQVFVNLLNNAAKFTPTRGRISVSVDIQGPDITVSVQDTGIGIAPTLLPHIFELFRQGEQPLARSQGGLGVGLTLVRELVAQHGGSVEAHSDGPGQGSTLLVRLPHAPRPREERGAPKAPPVLEGHGQGRRILLVDDNVDAAETLSDYLQGQGHDVRTAFDGNAALHSAASLAPDVIVLDIGLPELDGYQLAQRFRAAHPTASALLIALTGYGQARDKARALAAGFDHFLVKPINPEDLARLLRSN